MGTPIKSLRLTRETLRCLHVRAALRAGALASLSRFDEDPETAPILRSKVIKGMDDDTGSNSTPGVDGGG